MRIKADTLREFEKGHTMPLRDDLEKFSKVLSLRPADQKKLREAYERARLQAKLINIVKDSQEMEIETSEFDTQELEEGEPNLDLKEIGSSIFKKVDDIVFLSKLLRLPLPELISEIRKAVLIKNTPTWIEEREIHRDIGKRIVSGGLVTKVLRRYYTPEKLKMEKLVPYTFEVDGQRVDVAVASLPEWRGLSIPLVGLSYNRASAKSGKTQEKCQLVSVPPSDVHIDPAFAKRQLRNNEQMGTRLRNLPIYHLIDVTIAPHNLSLTFSLDTFFRYKFTNGFLDDEVTDAIVAADFDEGRVIARATELLRLREQLLPNGSHLVDFRNRMCVGGPVVCFAMARPKPDNDFVIFVGRRSEEVALTPGQLTVVPQGFHQPMVDKQAEINPSFTAYRELYEELFKGEEVVGGKVQAVKHDWFVDKSEPIRWFRDHPRSYKLECTSFAIELGAGRYAIGMLLAVLDEDYWKLYGGQIERNWEFLGGIEGLMVSSRNPEQIADVLQMPEWDVSLFALVEGLKRLKDLEKKRARLPSIELVKS
jgi:hypothetical protein